MGNEPRLEAYADHIKAKETKCAMIEARFRIHKRAVLRLANLNNFARTFGLDLMSIFVIDKMDVVSDDLIASLGEQLHERVRAVNPSTEHDDS